MKNKNCEKCKVVKLFAHNRSGFCRPCYVQNYIDIRKKPDRNCAGCDVILGRHIKQDLCRKCYMIKYYSIPENKLRRNETGKKWAKLNPERHREKSLRWQKKNPERVAEIRRKTMSGYVNRFTRAVYAAQRNHSWNLSKEQWLGLISKPCHYCNEALHIFGIGLDRMDNNIGYELQNVVPCCVSCNRIKSDQLSYDEMKAAMSAVLELRHKSHLQVVNG